MSRLPNALRVAALVALLLPTCLASQSFQVRDLEPGRTDPLAARGVQLYRFPALAGTRVEFSVWGAGTGRTVLTLYTPSGDEMVTASGDGAVTLQAILPLADRYYLSVVRTDSSAGGRLRLRLDQPTLYQYLFAEAVGYEVVEASSGQVQYSMCWLQPGSKIRITPVADQNYRRRETSWGESGEYGMWKQVWFMNDGLRVDTDLMVRIEGGVVTSTVSYQDRLLSRNQTPIWQPVAAGFRLGRYVGYNCR